MTFKAPLVSLDELVAQIDDGIKLAAPKDESGVPMAGTRALIRREVKDLHLLCVPVCGLQADLLIGVGSVRTVECGAIVLNEIGVGPRFRAAVRDGTIALKDSTCPVIHAGLQAAEKGLPFVAIRGILGSDLIHNRDDWRVINNPFSDSEDPVLLIPAITPDVFMFHAVWGDRDGNVWIGGRRDLAYTAHASKSTLVTVEALYDGNLMDNEDLAAGTLSSAYVSAIAHVPQGAWPLGLANRYLEDREHIQLYSRLARTEEGFSEYLAKNIFSAQNAA